MPPLILLALAGAGAYAGYKFFGKLMEQAAMPDREETDRLRREAAAHAARKAARNGTPSRDLGELEWDDAAGVYRPSRSSDG